MIPGFLRSRSFWALLCSLLILYFSLVGFWTGYYTKRKIIRDIEKTSGLSMDIGWCHIYPFTGNGTIKNIRISNPPGFLTKNALVIDEIQFTGNVKSLYSDEILLNTMNVKGITLNVDYKGGQTNLSTLAMNARSAYDRYYSDSEMGFKTIRLNQLSLDELLVNLGPKILNHEPPVLKLDAVAIESIGTDGETGTTVKRLGVRLAKTYVHNAETLLQIPPPGINENISEAMRRYIQIAKEYLDQR